MPALPSAPPGPPLETPHATGALSMLDTHASDATATHTVPTERRLEPAFGDMVEIPAGTFRMGSNEHYPEEAPVHTVAVDGFRIDRTPVTNDQFAAFVKATGHVTFAEIP